MNGCIRPGAVTDDELVAYAYGEATPDVSRHIESCPACAAAAGEYARLQRRLVGLLYRFDCPSADTLGDYQLNMLAQAERQQVAAHLADCPACAGELRELRRFLAVEPAPALVGTFEQTPAPALTGVFEQMKRIIIAVLMPAPPAAANGVRSMEGPSAQTYRAEDLTVTIHLEATARRGFVNLTGQIVQEGAAEATLAGQTVRLIPADGSAVTAEIGDMGDFFIEAVARGTYRLEVELPDRVVVVEALRVDN